jgi:hypothetical protein
VAGGDDTESRICDICNTQISGAAEDIYHNISNPGCAYCSKNCGYYIDNDDAGKTYYCYGCTQYTYH